MRQLALPFGLALVLLAGTPAFAGVGLPTIASVELGPHRAILQNDSPGLRKGTNMVTLEIFGLPAGMPATLRLTGPQGQVVEAPVQEITILGGPESGHGSSAGAGDGDHGAAMDMKNAAPAGGHGSSSSDHGSSAEAGHGGASDESASFNGRAKVNLNATGTWTAVLQVIDEHGETMVAETQVEVTKGGPSRPYVAVTGLAMGGSLVYGAVKRRKASDSGR